MGTVKWAPHISKQDLNQTLFISVIFYKLKAVEIVTGRMSASRGERKKKKKKRAWSLEERSWSSVGEEGWKSSKFTVIGRCLNVPFKLNGTCRKVAWALHIPPCASVSATEPAFLPLPAQLPSPPWHWVAQGSYFIISFYFSSLCSVIQWKHKK